MCSTCRLTVQSFLVGNDAYAVEEGKSTTLAVTANDPLIGSPTGVSYAFGINGADGTGHDVLVYGDTGELVPNPDPNPDPNAPPNSIVPEDQIDFVNDAVTVVNNRTLSVSIFQAPTKGTVVPGANNTFVYTPDGSRAGHRHFCL